MPPAETWVRFVILVLSAADRWWGRLRTQSFLFRRAQLKQRQLPHFTTLPRLRRVLDMPTAPTRPRQLLRLLAFSAPLTKPNPGSASVLLDELDAGDF